MDSQVMNFILHIFMHVMGTIFSIERGGINPILGTIEWFGFNISFKLSWALVPIATDKTLEMCL
jgi:hypothetical protein